jgi:four helix bundle protein
VIHSYKDLDVWKRSVALTTDLYKLTARFPGTERFGLSSQIQRAAISIPANLAEGWGRGSTREYVQFVTIARGSLMELETHLIIGCNLGFLNPDEFRVASEAIEEIGKMLNGLIRGLKSRQEAA